MPADQLRCPVAFLIFNRPDTTAKVFAEIAKARPPKLLVVADGPRADRPNEATKCTAARAIIDKVDWPCEVLKNYSDTNMGCRRRVSSGLTWVFETVEEAIVLEDDCVPHLTFFRFCEELLEKYREDERITQISGDNFQFSRRRTADSYYFSRYNHIWGWASWRRAWRYYDVTMKLWPAIRDGGWLRDLLDSEQAIRVWTERFEAAYRGEIDTWDYAWTFATWAQSGLTVLPNVNLVSNFGFGAEATHTRRRSRLANMAVEEMSFPLQHPPFVIRDSKADDFTETIFSLPLPVRLIMKARRILRARGQDTVTPGAVL